MCKLNTPCEFALKLYIDRRWVILRCCNVSIFAFRLNDPPIDGYYSLLGPVGWRCCSPGPISQEVGGT